MLISKIKARLYLDQIFNFDRLLCGVIKNKSGLIGSAVYWIQNIFCWMFLNDSTKGWVWISGWNCRRLCDILVPQEFVIAKFFPTFSQHLGIIRCYENSSFINLNITDFFQRLQDLLLSEMFQQLHRNCVHFCIKFKFSMRGWGWFRIFV